MNSAKQGSTSSSSSSSGGGASLMRCSSFSLQRTYSQPELTQVLQSIVQADKDNYLNKQKAEQMKLAEMKKKMTRQRSFSTFRPKSKGCKQPKDILAAKLKEKINLKLRATQSFDYSDVNRQERALASCENFQHGVPVRRCRSFIFPSYNSDQISANAQSLKRKRNENANENEQREPEAKKRSAIII